MKKLLKIFIFFLVIVLSGYFLILLISPSVYLNHLYEIEISDKKDQNVYSLIRNSISHYVTLEEVSEEFLTTIIEIEDKRFYSHNGLDYLRIGKSLFENVKANQITQGGSTITQQVARMAYLDNSKTYSRKIKEAIYAKKIEAKYSKEEILEMYINNCYFSHNIYGIYLASSYYFDKKPIDLNYSESALLVGIISSPNNLSPDIDYSSSIKKQQQILSILFENNILNIEEYYEELNRPLNFSFNFIDSSINLMYYQEGINLQLKELGLYTDNYLRQGIKVQSNIDIEVYNKVNEIVKKHQKNAKSDEISIVIMKPYSNEILTLIGGFDYSISQYNRALYSKRQIGSTIKPFLYYLGLKKGMTPLSKFYSKETTFNIDGIGPYSPKNASGFYANRKINMVEALALSDNIYAVKTTLLVGSSSLSNLLEQFNIKCEDVNPTLGLGSISITPLELTSMYNALASEGTYYKPSFIKKVCLQDNTILEKVKTKSKKVLDTHETLIINHLLKAPFDSSLASYTYPSLSSYQTAHTFGAKSGSTNSTNWVIGFNPNYTIGVYVGNDDNKDISSKKLAKIMFKEIADSLSKDQNDIYYEPDSNMKRITFYNSINNKTSYSYYVDKQ